MKNSLDSSPEPGDCGRRLCGNLFRSLGQVSYHQMRELACTKRRSTDRRKNSARNWILPSSARRHRHSACWPYSFMFTQLFRCSIHYRKVSSKSCTIDSTEIINGSEKTADDSSFEASESWSQSDVIYGLGLAPCVKRKWQA